MGEPMRFEMESRDEKKLNRMNRPFATWLLRKKVPRTIFYLYNFVGAYIFVLRLHHILFKYGLETTGQRLLGPWKSTSCDLPSSHILISETERAVIDACDMQFVRTECLVRAIACYWFFRLHGAQPKLLIGVRSRPFGSHAWVEVQGVPVGDYKIGSNHHIFKSIIRRYPQ